VLTSLVVKFNTRLWVAARRSGPAGQIILLVGKSINGRRAWGLQALQGLANMCQDSKDFCRLSGNLDLDDGELLRPALLLYLRRLSFAL